MTAETKCIGEGGAHCALLGLVEGEVERVVDLLVFVAFLMVDCGRNDVVGDSLDTGVDVPCTLI